MNLKKLIGILVGMLISCLASNLYAQRQPVADKIVLSNPIIPGYFAAPTIKKIGDTFYLFSMSDGRTISHAPSHVWKSKDLKHWFIQEMNWPTAGWYLSPDMTKGYDGQYYLYYSQPFELFAARSSTPDGPWTSLLKGDRGGISNHMVPGVIASDGHTFTDTDGKIYFLWGTRGNGSNHGLAIGELNRDMKSFTKTHKITSLVAKDFVESPSMFKRKGIYYLFYSSGRREDDSYRIQYIRSKNGPFGPFEQSKENIILKTNTEGAIEGPGHSSVFEHNGRYFIVYHKHKQPILSDGFYRQVAIQELSFDEEGNIYVLESSLTNIDLLGRNTRPFNNLALGKNVQASSSYNDNFKPEFALDHDHGTLWKSRYINTDAWITVDLGSSIEFNTVLLEFEYPTSSYQYLIEISDDNKMWRPFINRSDNDKWASPIIEKAKAKARYIRLTILNSSLQNVPVGLWGIKVYKEVLKESTHWSSSQRLPLPHTFSDEPIVKIKADNYTEGELIKNFVNDGRINGSWNSAQGLFVKNYHGKKAFYFDGSSHLQSTFLVPNFMQGNASYSVEMLVCNPSRSLEEPLLTWASSGDDWTEAIFGYGEDEQVGIVKHGGWSNMGTEHLGKSDTWKHIVITYDGYIERIYINGVLRKEQVKMLFVKPDAHFRIGGIISEHFYSGYLAELSIRDYSMSKEDINNLYQEQMKSTYKYSFESSNLQEGKLTTIDAYDSNLLPAISSCGSCEVKIADNRIYIDLKQIESKTLYSILQESSWTMSMEYLEKSTWNQVIIFNRGGQIQIYENGTPSTKPLKSFFSLKDNKIKFAVQKVHNLRVYNTLEVNVSSLFNAFSNKIKLPLIQREIEIETAPYKINSISPFIAMKNIGPYLEYRFLQGFETSPWLREPFYLFKEYNGHIQIGVQVRDIYGNVSNKKSVAVRYPKLTLLSDQEIFDWVPSSNNDTVAFWDEIQLNEQHANTETKITKGFQGWMLGSKNTAIHTERERGPFLFQHLKGDFTMEVRVADIAGKMNGKLMNNEVGIMILSDNSPSSFISHTVLTGDNIGNVGRNVSAEYFKEYKNGKGMLFEPFLQIQKVGDKFYLRTSRNGRVWNNMPNSPFTKSEFKDQRLKVGIYQAAGSNEFGYGIIHGVHIWTYKFTDTLH